MAKKKPKEISKSGLSDELIYCARLYRSYLAKNLHEHGLFPGQEHMLKALRKSNGQTMGELAIKLRVRPPTVTKMVNRMSAQDLITRLASKDDNRQSHIFITQKGMDLYQNIKSSKQLTQKMALKNLSKTEKIQFKKILKKITAMLLHLDTPPKP